MSDGKIEDIVEAVADEIAAAQVFTDPSDAFAQVSDNEPKTAAAAILTIAPAYIASIMYFF